MKTLTTLLLLAFAELSLQGAVVNSVRCTSTATCASTWNVTAGNVLVIGRWYRSLGGGALTDTQGSVYKSLRAAGGWSNNTKLDATVIATGGAPITVTSSAVEQNMVLAEISGASLDVLGAANILANNSAVCGPLSITVAADAVLLSIWAIDAGGAQSCTATTGDVVGGSCGGFSGQMTAQRVTAGTYTQQFTFLPRYNEGNADCGMVALAAQQAAPQPHCPVCGTVATETLYVLVLEGDESFTGSSFGPVYVCPKDGLIFRALP